MAGRVDYTFDGYTGSRAMIQAGKLRPLAVTGTARIAPLPNVPTFREAGFDFTYKLWLGMMVPTGTPKVAIQRLSDALKHALSQKDIIDRWNSEGSDPSFVSPEDMTKFLEKDYADMARLAVDLKYEKQ